MPSEELRKKLQRRKEEAEAARLPERLGGVRTQGYRQDGEMPDWPARALAEFQRTDSVPASRIGDEASDDEVDRWIEDFAAEAGIGARFYVRTGMELFPWLDCAVTGPGWAGSLRRELGGDLVLLSHDAQALVVIFEEEYDYQAFRHPQRAPRPPGDRS
ncbi:hypothetical protein [Streptomyces sp. NPDC085932]|uniref:hypothetical protein n=1 Tax=Streptomyces sp. NPDC085932 TaxID=3365741 RepID=UPI0037D4209B